MGATASQITNQFTQPFIQVQIKEKSKLRVTGLCANNSTVAGEFAFKKPVTRKNASIWWRHHVYVVAQRMLLVLCFCNIIWLRST